MVKAMKRNIKGFIRATKEFIPALRWLMGPRMRWQALQDSGLVVIGPHSYGLPNVLYWDYKTKLVIGKYCSISEGTTFLLGGEHRGDWVSTYPFGAFAKAWPSPAALRDHTISKGDITVGHDVWIGHGSVILSGVTIGNGAIIGAGSIVTKDIEDFAVVGGNPARLIKYRFDEATRKRVLDSAWWDWPEEKILANLDLLMDSPKNFNPNTI